MRIGQGYHVQRVEEKSKKALTLAGVDIPWSRCLVGHGDADVLSRAIADSILGAMGLGDIGLCELGGAPLSHSATGLELLEKTAGLMAREGYRLGNLDATVVAQQPRLREYYPIIRQNIAKALGTCAERISVKGTTESWLGYTGEMSGVAAQAVCLLNTTE